MDDLEIMLERINDFPTLPTIYTNLMKAMSDADSTIREVAEIVSSDQATSIKVLKFANSSVFSVQNKINNISDAIFYLGFNEVKNIVLALSVMKLFDGIQSYQQFNILKFWRHSIGTGVIARHLASQLNVKDIESFFISGIMHDIGKLFLIMVFKDKYLNIINYAHEKNLNLHQLEKSTFGFDHSYAGSLIAKKWNIPDNIKNTIEYHHLGKVNGKLDLQTSCIHIADIVSYLLNFGSSGDPIVKQPNFEVWEILNFPDKFFSNSHMTLINNYQQAIQILSL